MVQPHTWVGAYLSGASYKFVAKGWELIQRGGFIQGAG